MYEFTIIHKPGKIHSNADAISRMLCSLECNTIIREEILSDVSPKTLDPWEDANLLKYLKLGKHTSGISKKQIKRIENTANHFIFDNDKKIFKENMNDSTIKRIVPRPEERIDITRRSHLLGHFSSLKTLKDLQSKFYWKHMNSSVEFVIKNCLQCLRFKKSKKFDQPAMALHIGEVCDRVEIDLIFGLPLTVRGNKGCCVETEYTTNYPDA